MLNVVSILEQNKELITQYINALFLKDTLQTKYPSFYSLIPIEAIRTILPYITEQDIQQDIYLHIVEYARSYKESEEEFGSLLKIHIPWLLRNKVNTLLNYHNFKARVSEEPIEWAFIDEPLPKFNLAWVLQEDTIPLSSYERYVLYLRLYKCYTIQQIANATYQDRKTAYLALLTAQDILRNYFNEQ